MNAAPDIKDELTANRDTVGRSERVVSASKKTSNNRSEQLSRSKGINATGYRGVCGLNQSEMKILVYPAPRQIGRKVWHR
jgi:hypothetical protein